MSLAAVLRHERWIALALGAFALILAWSDGPTVLMSCVWLLVGGLPCALAPRLLSQATSLGGTKTAIPTPAISGLGWLLLVIAAVVAAAT